MIGEAILGANIFKDIFGAIRDVVGGRSGVYEQEMGRARKIAFREMEEQAERLGADGIVGMHLSYWMPWTSVSKKVEFYRVLQGVEQ